MVVAPYKYSQKKESRKKQMPVNYNDPQGSIAAEKKRKEAQEGKVPAGTYNVKLMKADYTPGTNEAKTLWRWCLTCRFIMPNPKDVFHRAERFVMFFDTDARWANGQMELFFEFLKKLGLNLTRGGDVSEPRDIEDWLDKAIEKGLQFKLEVSDAMSWDKEKRIEVPNEKYPNKFEILIDSVPAVITKIKEEMGNSQGEEATDEAPTDDPADETAEDQEQAPPQVTAPPKAAPAPKGRGPWGGK